MNFGEVSGVAVNSKGHVFVLLARQHHRPGLWAAAAQLLEFGARRRFHPRNRQGPLRLVLCARPCASTRTTTSGPSTRARTWSSSSIRRAAWPMVFGRKQEAADEETGPWKHPNRRCRPRRTVPPADRRCLGLAGQHLHQRRLHQFARRQGRQERRLGEVLGHRGNGPGQFNTPHGDRRRPKDNVYVADRGNRRIQVFDADGKFLRQFTIDVPSPPTRARQSATSRRAELADGHAWRRRALGALHHAAARTGALQSDAYPGPHLQADARRQGAGRARPSRASSSSNSAGSTRSPARPRTNSMSPSCSTGGCRS